MLQMLNNTCCPTCGAPREKLGYHKCKPQNNKEGGSGTNDEGVKFTISGGKGGNAEPGDILFSDGKGNIQWEETIEEIITKRLDNMPNYEEYMVRSTMKVLAVNDIKDFIKQVEKQAFKEGYDAAKDDYHIID